MYFYIHTQICRHIHFILLYLISNSLVSLFICLFVYLLICAFTHFLICLFIYVSYLFDIFFYFPFRNGIKTVIIFLHFELVMKQGNLSNQYDIPCVHFSSLGSFRLERKEMKKSGENASKSHYQHFSKL